jgi:ABC-type uncharacterized transport system involved in gliding motility auxiliary subunit
MKLMDIYNRALELLKRGLESVKKPSGKTSDRMPQIILNALILVLLNIAAVTLNWRCDLTSTNTYSLSQKSRKVVSTLKENMKIKVLFSPDLPAQHMAVYRYLRDLLDEYDYYGNRHFSYEIVDGKDLEKQAADYGIQPVQSQEFADDQVKLRRTYMGLVIQHADLIEKVNALTGTVGLEYEITSRMEKMASKIDGLLNLDKPITIRLYLDSRMKDLPIRGIDHLADDVRRAVDAGNRRNYNKLAFEMVDTSKDNSIDSAAGAYGLNKIQWKAGRGSAGALPAGEGLLNIVAIHGDRFRVIDLDLEPSILGNYSIKGIEGLEDTINSAVGRLLATSEKVGYVTGHGIPDMNDDRSREGAGFLKELLSDKYEMVPVDLSKNPVPQDVTILIINGPREALSEAELYRFDQYLMAGNRAIIFADNFDEMQMPGGQEMFQQQQPVVVPVNNGLDGILASYGVTVDRNIVLDENCTKVNLGQMNIEYPLIPVILKKNLDRESVVTKYLNSAAFLKASSVTLNQEKLKAGKIAYRNLISSSSDSWTMTGRMSFNPLMMDANKPDKKQSYPLAVEISGSFESFFRGKDIPKEAAAGITGSLTSVKRLDGTISSGKSGLIVVGTSQITRSGFLMDARKVLSGGGREDEVYSNEHLLHSMVDSLAGNDYIPEMQSKSLAFNPIDKTDDSTRFALKVINIAGVPALVIALGLVAWRRRVERKKAIFSDFNPEAANE